MDENENGEIKQRIEQARHQVLMAESALDEGTAAERLRWIADELNDIRLGIEFD